jgi:hypothetical protein
MQKHSLGPEAERPRPAAAARAISSIEPWLRRHSLLVFVLLVTLASMRIAATYAVFSHTVDEPAHLACGMEWLSQGTYSYETQHPPLARVAAALGPFLAGETSQNLPEKWQEGLAILAHGGHYERNLALARLGILPFFWLACWVVYAWTRRYLGTLQALLAVLLFTNLPPVLAHAGLATTDMALAATTGAAFLAAARWCEHPGPLNSLVFGGATGLAVLSKLSALAFIPVALFAALVLLLAGAPLTRNAIAQYPDPPAATMRGSCHGGAGDLGRLSVLFRAGAVCFRSPAFPGAVPRDHGSDAAQPTGTLHLVPSG